MLDEYLREEKLKSSECLRDIRETKSELQALKAQAKAASDRSIVVLGKLKQYLEGIHDRYEVLSPGLTAVANELSDLRVQIRDEVTGSMVRVVETTQQYDSNFNDIKDRIDLIDDKTVELVDRVKEVEAAAAAAKADGNAAFALSFIILIINVIVGLMVYYK